MSEYWKSNPKKYCEYCKCWMAANKPSIAIHEQGRTHKDNVKAKLLDIKKKECIKREEDKIYNDTMAEIDKAAAFAMARDIYRNPDSKVQYGNTAASRAIAQASVASSSVLLVREDPKVTEKRKLEEVKKRRAESRIGEWQSNKTGHIVPELNLPSGNKLVKQMKLEAERELEEDKFETAHETAAINIKQETSKQEHVKEEPIIQEKIVTLNSSSSSTKQIAFKKRRIEGQQQKQRSTD